MKTHWLPLSVLSCAALFKTAQASPPNPAAAPDDDTIQPDLFWTAGVSRRF